MRVLGLVTLGMALTAAGPEAQARAPSVTNVGAINLYGVLVHVGMTTTGKDRASRSFVVDVPKHGTAEITAELPLLDRYAVVLVHGLQVSEHAPFGSWAVDPTPDDAMGFRVVNPRLAPKGYAAWVKAQCGPCRGF